ncbi:hypothetical protein AB685_14585 [Bacillus sp. LL01]|nr:hypothetical protein AB685_14585 [Bacillus sp. LL01]
MKETDGKLLDLYGQLWNCRSLPYAIGKGENVLYQAIRRELKDEWTHPRTRRKPVEKYAIAIKRIMDSPLKDSEQLLLMKVYTNVLDELKKES